MISKEAEEYSEKKLQSYRTLCCKSKPYRKGRANYRCVKCDGDVTMEMALLAQMFIEEYKHKIK